MLNNQYQTQPLPAVPLTRENYRPFTPVKYRKIAAFAHDYPDQASAKTIINGFKQGFSLGYQGLERPRDSTNLTSALQRPQVFRDKILKELSTGWILGPFKQRPLQNLQCSPLGLVPKKRNSNKWRLITHLSFPHGDSINSHIPKSRTSVQYASFDHALKLVRHQGRNYWIAKADIDSAFCQIPMNFDSLQCLGFMWQK